MTTNIGSSHIDENARIGKAGDEVVRHTVLAELNNYFRPEFLNRIDEIVVFHSLTERDLVAIVDIQLVRFSALLADRQIKFIADEKAKQFIAHTGFDPVYGARPLKRVIQRMLENPISRMLVAGEVREGQTIQMTREADTLKFHVNHMA
jgi:ATP-dependent Clp protease ATP-binding subunit ClpB